MTANLSPGFYNVPAGMVATVVTHLEMAEKAPLRPAPTLEDVEFTSLTGISGSAYRDLFNRVGAQDWLWFSRMEMAEAELAAILRDQNVALYTLTKSGRPEALLELDFRETGACELAFFGVSPVLLGSGAGRVLMNHAIDLAWARRISRFHVHTCTLDHPNALSFYQRSGFVPVRQQVEIAPDPRLTGVLPEGAGSHIPMFKA